VIEKLLENDKEGFYLDLAALSAFQLQHFSFAIPESLQHQWLAGLQSGKEIYKLCGAGGGGYVLCFNR
jgi:mevalonate kinase